MFARTWRRPCRVFSLIGVFAATGLLGLLTGVPTAGATVTQMMAHPDMSYGPLTNYGTGCTYTVQARLTEPNTMVTFYDNGVPFATVRPSGGTALVKWTPPSVGPHTLQAVQPTTDANFAPEVQVNAGVGMPIAYSCLVI